MLIGQSTPHFRRYQYIITQKSLFAYNKADVFFLIQIPFSKKSDKYWRETELLSSDLTIVKVFVIPILRKIFSFFVRRNAAIIRSAFTFLLNISYDKLKLFGHTSLVIKNSFIVAFAIFVYKFHIIMITTEINLNSSKCTSIQEISSFCFCFNKDILIVLFKSQWFNLRNIVSWTDICLQTFLCFTEKNKQRSSVYNEFLQ